MVPWWSCYYYCTTSFNKAWSQVRHRFKSCSWRVGDSRWWRSLTMAPAGNKAKRLSSVNHNTKTIHHHHLEKVWHMSKVDNKDTWTTSVTSFYVFIVNFERMSQLFLLFLLLTLNKVNNCWGPEKQVNKGEQVLSNITFLWIEKFFI